MRVSWETTIESTWSITSRNGTWKWLLPTTDTNTSSGQPCAITSSIEACLIVTPSGTLPATSASLVV